MKAGRPSACGAHPAEGGIEIEAKRMNGLRRTHDKKLLSSFDPAIDMRGIMNGDPS